MRRYSTFVDRVGHTDFWDHLARRAGSGLSLKQPAVYSLTPFLDRTRLGRAGPGADGRSAPGAYRRAPEPQVPEAPAPPSARAVHLAGRALAEAQPQLGRTRGPAC